MVTNISLEYTYYHFKKVKEEIIFLFLDLRKNAMQNQCNQKAIILK